MVVRLAMWSGPRNISTALMRAFENRGDAIVWDEPLYAHYLQVTGTEHPGPDEVIAAGEPDWRRVVARLVGPLPDGVQVFYQKHMAHHMLPVIERAWLGQLTHAFLLRDPREMLLSLAKIMRRPGVADTGLPQQLELFELIRRSSGTTPPVLDARDVLGDPEAMLRRLCAAVRIPFDTAMLSWPAGPRDSDGVWAKYWYASVEASTGFEPWRPREGTLRPDLEPVLAECQPIYDTLYAERIHP